MRFFEFQILGFSGYIVFTFYDFVFGKKDNIELKSFDFEEAVVNIAIETDDANVCFNFSKNRFLGQFSVHLLFFSSNPLTN